MLRINGLLKFMALVLELKARHLIRTDWSFSQTRIATLGFPHQPLSHHYWRNILLVLLLRPPDRPVLNLVLGLVCSPVDALRLHQMSCRFGVAIDGDPECLGRVVALPELGHQWGREASLVGSSSEIPVLHF